MAVMQVGIPVDQPLVAIDQPFLVELHEDLDDGARQPLVHGEALARPVAGRAEPFQLIDDDAAGLGLPRPHLLHEGLAADGAAVRLLPFHHPPLDHHLRGDAGVIHARLPEHVLAAHALEADQDVLQRVVERMPHMERAGDVRRRDDDREMLRARLRARPGAEGVRLLPKVTDLGLDARRVVGLVQHCGSGCGGGC